MSQLVNDENSRCVKINSKKQYKKSLEGMHQFYVNIPFSVLQIGNIAL